MSSVVIESLESRTLFAAGAPVLAAWQAQDLIASTAAVAASGQAIAAAGTSPTAPSALAGKALSGAQIALTWTDTANNETGFEIQRSASYTFSSPTTITLNTANLTGYTVGGLTKITWYYLRVRAINSAGASPYTKSVKIKTLSTTPVNTLDTALNNAITFAQSQLKQTMNDLGNSTTKFVNRTSNSTGLWNVVGAGDWTSGFLGGQMWQLFTATSDSYWSGKATAWTTPLAGQATAKTEDLYFRLMTTFLPLYQQTGNVAYRQVLLDAAASKNTQWNETVGAFETTWRKSSSGNPAANYGVLMDQTTDMLLMLWAAKETNNQTYYDRAVRHTRNVVNYLLRPDGSSYQFGYFDKTTGSFIGGETSQGYANESTWSRGQAWSIFALTAVARETGLSDILAGAQKAADWFISRLPVDFVPYWDFNAPITASTYRDSSAAAIAASGLLDLCTLVPVAGDQTKYRNAAAAMLTSLSSSAYLAQGSISHGILLHGAQNVPNVPAGNDVSLSFGDYFFLQAINRYKALGL